MKQTNILNNMTTKNQEQDDIQVEVQVDDQEQQEEAAKARGQWSNQLEFILTCIGYAVGLGNVWRFPYLCFKNGGGAFLIPYALMLLLLGIPMFGFELSLGQFAGKGPIALWDCVPIMRGVGYGMLGISLIISLYYQIIIVWSCYYFFSSMAAQIPWEDCKHDWNTPRCLTSNESFYINNDTALLNFTLEARNLTSAKEFETPSEQFYYYRLLDITEGLEHIGAPVWPLVGCLALCWLITFLVLIKGIHSLGKVNYVLTVAPYVMMTALLIRGVTLEGAMKGIEYYMVPDYERLLDPNVWSDAATQIFFSLCTCSGGLLAMASYNDFKNNVFRDTLLVPILNCLTSIFCGFAVFSVLGFMAHQKGVGVEDVARSGPGLVFVVYPEALSQMPVPQLWSALFFIILIMMGFSSEFTDMETVFTIVMDQFPWLRVTKLRTISFRALAILAFFVITLPMVFQGGFYLFQLVDAYIGGYPLLIMGLFETIAIAWIYGASKFADDILLMIGLRPHLLIQLVWKMLVPGCILLIIALTAMEHGPLVVNEYEYPGWANGIGWCIVIFTSMWIPIIAIHQVLLDGGWQAIVLASTPISGWRFRANTMTREKLEHPPVPNTDRKIGRARTRSSLSRRSVADVTLNTEPTMPTALKGYNNNAYNNTNERF